MTSSELNYWIFRAKEIATMAHKGQMRKDGKTPYIVHPSRVAASVEDRLKPIAWLHDVPEDTHITLEYLKSEGFPEYVIVAVDLLTKRKGEENMRYWGRIKNNPDALAVKRKDINDNVNDAPSPLARGKYSIALAFFDKVG